MYLDFPFVRFSLLALPLASGLSIPQKILTEDPEDAVSDPAQNLTIENVKLKITAYTPLVE